MTTTKDFFERVKEDFAREIVELTNGEISIEEANKIANINLRPTDFSDDSPLQHKSVRWLAMSYLNLI